MDKSSKTSRATINLSVPIDMKEWLEVTAQDNETNVAPIVRSIIRKAMNEEKEG